MEYSVTHIAGIPYKVRVNTYRYIYIYIWTKLACMYSYNGRTLQWIKNLKE